MQRTARILATSVAALAIASLPARQAWANAFTACGQYCASACPTPPGNCIVGSGSPKTCTLTGDLHCTSANTAGWGLSTTSTTGIVIDLSGYNVLCDETPPNNCNYPAISLDSSASGQKVTNSNATEAVIDGPFYSGVDCNLAAGSTVEKITVLDPIIGILDCKTVTNNVLGAAYDSLLGGQWGVWTAGMTGDSIVNNSVSGRTIPITTGGSTKIWGNVIDTAGAAFGVYVNGSGSTNIKYNVFFGPGYDASAKLVTVTGTDNGTYEKNLCDIHHPDCASCIASTPQHCTPYTAPFAGNS